jgi:hypothetical protein
MESLDLVPPWVLRPLPANAGADAQLEGDRLIREAWPLVVRAGANSDFPVVADFALENELIVALENPSVGPSLAKGTRIPSWFNPIDGSEMVWIAPGPFLVGFRPACLLPYRPAT